MDWLSPLKTVFEFIFPFFDSVPFIRAILGFILVFLLPGYTWTLVFFRQLKPLERIPVSLALSIALVTLSLIFASRLFNTELNGFNAVMLIILITILPIAVYYLNRLIRKRLGKATQDDS